MQAKNCKQQVTAIPPKLVARARGAVPLAEAAVMKSADAKKPTPMTALAEWRLAAQNRHSRKTRRRRPRFDPAVIFEESAVWTVTTKYNEIRTSKEMHQEQCNFFGSQERKIAA